MKSLTLTDLMLIALTFLLLLVLADLWQTQMMPYKVYETRDFINQLFNIGRR